jgi:hypothetical protein
MSRSLTSVVDPHSRCFRIAGCGLPRPVPLPGSRRSPSRVPARGASHRGSPWARLRRVAARWRALGLGLSLLASAAPPPAAAQAPERKIAEMELLLLGVSATVEPLNPVIPKNTDAAVRIVVRAGGRDLSISEAAAFFGPSFWVEGELSGSGLEETATLSSRGSGDGLPPDPLLLPIPAFRSSGEYELNNLRVMAGGRPVLEVQPQHVPVKVIDQVLVTSVTTRPLTLDEIRAKGIVLDSDDYYAFEFTLGLELESKAVNLTFPVAFDRQGVPVPQFITPPAPPTRDGVPLPTIIPVLLEMDQEGGDGGSSQRLPPMPNGGGEIRIPSVIVIPGNVGYLKQFFSAKLFVANGAPVGSGLTVREVTGTIALPVGKDLAKGTKDDPLSFAELLRDGKKVIQPETMHVRGVGPDGEPSTGDDVDVLAPAEQGEAEFLIRGESEGFHTIGFDIRAVLEGLVTGPVKIKGKASGAVLVRNPYFDVSFTVPGVYRVGEPFSVFVTLTNLSESSAANEVSLALPENSTSKAKLVGELPPVIPTLGPGESKSLELRFVSDVTGQVVASYLRFDPKDGEMPTSSLQLSVGIGERGVPLSPDTLVLPAAVDTLPSSVVAAAMRVLGQAWSVANAPAGTLPKGIVRTSRNVVTQKALALAEAGLRMSLGQERIDAVRDVAFDFWGGQPLDAGFDQLLRTTEAGEQLQRAIGLALAEGPGAIDLESALAAVVASGPDFASFAVAGGDPAAPLGINLVDATGRRTSTRVAGQDLSQIPGAALFPLGTEPSAPVLGIVATAAGAPFRLEVASAVDTVADVSITLPKGDGTFVRGEFRGVAFQAGTVARLAHDPLRPGEIVLAKEDEPVARGGTAVVPQGPQLVSATIIGPETLQGASPFGFQVVALFDRVVDGASAARKESYAIPRNAVQGARRQLSGRLVFASLEQPEGGPEYVPTTFSVLGGVTDSRGNEGPSGTRPMASRLEDPGAIVSGRVFTADGTPVSSGVVTYVNNSDLSCYRPNETGFAAQALDSEGHYEFRYVRRDNCGLPFKIVTVDPATGGRRQASAFVRAAGEAITLDLALFGRGAVRGTVSDVKGVVPGASVVAYSQTDPQIGGATTTDGLGRYFVDGITVGPIVVKAAKGVAIGSTPGRIERAGTTATVDLTLDGKAARVYGVVYKLENGKQTTVPGVYVFFKHDGQVLGATTTGADGSYAFDEVPAGQFEVSAAINARDRDAKQGVAVEGTSVSKDLLIVIPRGADLATVSGQVFLPGGQEPARDVVVSVGGRGVASSDGSFTIEGVGVQGAAQTVLARSRDGRRTGSTTVLANEPRLYGGLRIVLSGMGNAAFRVLDEGGKPVKGQQVAILTGCLDPCGCAHATTDADGIALFQNVSYGSLTAQAVRSTATSTDAARGSLSIQADGETVLTTMSFAGAGVVEGTVRDSAGSPVHGADVSLWSNRFENDGATVCGLKPGFSAGARTGLDGKFRFAGTNVGPVSVSAQQDFLGSAAIGNKGTLTSAGQTLVLDMKFDDTTAGVLSGSVYLPGEALAGAGVQVALEGPLPEVTVTTDASGHYEFPHILPEGYYKLTARDPVGGGLARLDVTLKRQEDRTQNVQLKGQGTVRVQVVSGDDEPVESAQVKLTETSYPSRTFDQSVRPGNDGRVAFRDVYEGPLRIDVSDPFARSGSVTSQLPGPGQEVSVKVKVTPTGRVSGLFLMPDRKTRVPYGTIVLKASGRVVGQATAAGSGSDIGRYAFDYVPVGPVTLDAQDPATGRVGFKAGTLDHEGDPPLVLDVIAQGLGRVHGTVTRGASRQPLARVTISSGSYQSTTLTDGSGDYDVSGVPEGRVTVTASLNEQGFLAGSGSEALEGDGASVKIDVALRDAGSVQGRIVPASEEDREAGLFPATTVRFTVGGAGGGSQETSSRPDGTFSFDLVPAGRVTFTADVADSIDGGSATVDVVAGDNAVEIPLQGVGSLEGTALASDEDGALPVDGVITFTGTAFPTGAAVQVGNDGTFRLPEVLAGKFTAQLRHGQGALALYGSASGTVLAGQEQTLHIALQPSGEIRGSVFRPAATQDGRRPAFGAEVTVVLTAGGEIPLLAQEDGSFVLKGVRLGAFTIRVFDPISEGRAVRVGLSLSASDRCGSEGATCRDVGEIRIDDQPPALSFVQPAPGSTRAPFGGLLVIDAPDDVDPSSIVVRYANGHWQGASQFAFENGRFSGTLYAPAVQVGANHLTVSAKDTSGNTGGGEATFTVTGGTVRGLVIGADDRPAPAGVPVKLGTLELVTDDEGHYRRDGLRAGSYTATATDPVTGLDSPSSSGLLPDGGELVLDDLRLPAAGSIAGTVVHSTNAPAGEGIAVVVGGRTYTTGAGGLFATAALLPKTYVVDAYGPDGDRGHRSVEVEAGAPTPVTVVLNGVGSVKVTVRKAEGGAAVGAIVKVHSSAGFPDPDSSTTGASGEAVFPAVLAGTVSATASYRGLDGSAAEQVLPDGAHRELAIALEPSALLAGRVRSAGGSGVVGATVRLTGPRDESTTSGSEGAYAFTEVPLGPFTVEASTPDGDKGRETGVLGAAAAPVDVTLAGFGDLVVVVHDADDAAIEGAIVNVASVKLGWLGASSTNTQGRASFEHTRAGELDLSVDARGLTAQRRVTLPAGGNLTETFLMGARGSVSGTVRAPGSPDGVVGVQVTVGDVTTVTGSGGRYTVGDLVPRTYTIDAKVDGRLRARMTVEVRSGETADGSLELVGVGTIRGTVRSGPAVVEGAAVETQVGGAFGGKFTAETGPDGSYALTGIPVQSALLAVTARKGELSADGRVRIEYDGQEAPLDFALLSSAVAVPRSLSDGNKVPWEVQPDGSLRRSYVFGLGAAPASGGPRLSLVRGTEEKAFVGRGQPGLEATEDGQRETVLSEEGLHGLRVTRKVFVPQDGYFARFLEVLENDGGEPVTVDLVLRAALTDQWYAYGAGAPQLLPRTSPRFVVVDDARSTDFYLSSWQTDNQLPPLAIAFGGSEEQAPAVELSGYELQYRWSGVTVPPHGRTAVMHAWTSQSDRPRAEASAARLAGLPPELLSGLSAAEAEAVRNFTVPPDPQGALPALPPNDGIVTVRVLAGDGQTPVSTSSPLFRSRSPHYGSLVSTTDTNPYVSDGRFALAGTATDMVPRVAFDLTTSVPDFGTVSATASGSFPSTGVVELSAAEGRTLQASSSASISNAPTKAFDFSLDTAWKAAADDSLDHGRTPWLEVTFPAPVTVERVVVRGSASGGFATRARLELFDAAGQPAGAVESFDLPGPAHDADVVLPSPVAGVSRVRFVALEGSGSPALAELSVYGEGDLGAVRRADVDLVFRGTGIVDALVVDANGDALSGYSVLLSRAGVGKTLKTSSEGRVRFLVVPEGPGWTIRATHADGGASVVRQNVSVAPGPAAPAIELRFPAFATLTCTLRSYAGQPASGWVVLSSAAGYSKSLYVNPQLTSFDFTDVPPGSYTLKATDSRTSAVVRTAAFGVTAGPNTAPALVFPPVGTIRVTTTSGHEAYAGAKVRWRSPSSEIDWRGPYLTDAAGQLTLSNVAGPGIDLEVSRPDLPLAPLTRRVTFDEELDVLDEAFDLPNTITLSGTLRALDGVPYPSRLVEVWNAGGTARIAQVTTNSTGAFSVIVPPGIVWLRAAGDCGSTWGEVRVDLATTATADALLPRGSIARPGQHDFWEIDLESPRSAGLWAYGAHNGSASPLANGTLQAYRSDATAVPSSNAGQLYADLEAGRYLLAAGASSGSTGGYDVCGYYWPGIGLRSWGGPWVRGQALSGGAALSSHGVRLVRPDRPTLETATDDSGSFALPLLVPGEFTIEVVDSAGVVVGRATGAAEPDADVALPPVDIPQRATVSVLVERAGVGIAGVAVTLTSDNPDALAEDAEREVTTGDDGMASALVPAGTVTAALDPIATACGKGPQGESACTDSKPAPAAFTFALPDLPTTVIVRVTALDGLTPLPSAYAEIAGIAAPAPVDVDGVVVFTGVPAGRREVHAWAAGREAYQDVDLAGGEATAAVALPVPAIRATLTDSRGAVVAGGTVEACGTELVPYCSWYPYQWCYSYPARTCVTAPASSDGAHVFDQLGRWVSSSPVDLTGRVPASNASAALTGVLVDQASTVVYPVELRLPPTGQVHGTVVTSDASGPVRNAGVWISTDGGEPVALTPDEEGSFAAPYVLSGHVTVHAEDPQDAIPGQVRIDLAADRDETVQVRLVPSAVLTLHFDAQDWGRGVDVESPEAPRRPGATAWRRTLTPSPDESVAVTVPSGWYRVLAPSSESYATCSTPAAGAEGIVTDLAEVSLSLGTHLYLRRGAAPSIASYDRSYDGDDQTCQAGGPFVATTVAGIEDYPNVGEPRPEGATEPDVRGARTLSAVGDGARARREQFTPASGAFGRTTTFVTNAGQEARAWTIHSALALPRGSWTIAATTDGDDTFDPSDTWLVLDNGEGERLGLILGLGTSRTGALRSEEHCGEGCYTDRWLELSETLAVGAGDTVAFTTFTLSRSSTPEDVALEMEDLLDQDAVAFEGLSPEERAQVVNLPPQGPPTGVSGIVRTPSGDVVPRAMVGVLRDGFLVAQRQANEAGEFAVKGLVPGPVTVVARDPDTNRPGRIEATVNAGVVETLGDLFLLQDADLGRVDAQVEYEGGGAAVGETLLVEVDGFGAFWQATIVTDGEGRGSAVEVPAGTVTLRWAGTGDESKVTSGALPPGGVLPLPLVVPVTAESVEAPVVLAVDSGAPFLVDASGAVFSSDYGCSPFCGSWASVNGEEYGGSSPVSLVRHREVVTPAEEKAGIVVTRRTFVPYGGTFVRLVDVLQNPGSEDQVVRYQLSTAFQAAAGDWEVVATSNGDTEFTPDDTFAVIRAADSGQTAAIVRGGSGSHGLPNEPVWDAPVSSANDTSVWTELRVPAGQTVRLMQFLVTVPDSPTAVEDARDLAQSLADLTEPNALVGLGAAEQATLHNFGGPGNP